jgi:hypothetical protein
MANVANAGNVANAVFRQVAVLPRRDAAALEGGAPRRADQNKLVASRRFFGLLWV